MPLMTFDGWLDDVEPWRAKCGAILTADYKELERIAGKAEIAMAFERFRWWRWRSAVTY
jgi:hypothetical protein